MATTPTKLNILNSALRKVGSYFLDASDTSSTTYQIVTQAYDDAILEVFSENVFGYNTKQVTLTAINATAYTDTLYEYAFNFPADFNFIINISHPTEFYHITDYQRVNGQLQCNHPSITLTYTYVPDLSSSATTLPAYINRLVVLHIAQAISIELSGSENRHEILNIQYNKALRRARVVEGRQGPAMSFVSDDSSRLIESHQRYGEIQ
jgi:hypothetical protein